MFSTPVGQRIKQVEITHVLCTNPQFLIWQAHSLDISDWGNVKQLLTG